MDGNSLFQGQGNQMNYGGGINWGSQNANQAQYYGSNYMGRTTATSFSNMPVRVIFSPEQIAPQDIPTNGTPALFPLFDGSRIIAKRVMGNGMIEESVYALQQPVQNGPQGPSEFDQVMSRLGGIEDSLKRVLNDLYGGETKNQNISQEGAVNNG